MTHTENTATGTPDIQSTHSPAQKDTTETDDEAPSGDPSLEQFQTGAGLESVRAQDPQRYIKATTCWLHGNHLRSKTRIAIQVNDRDEVFALKCEALKTSTKCRYTIGLVYERWLDVGPTGVEDATQSSARITESKKTKAMSGGHMREYLNNRNQKVPEITDLTKDKTQPVLDMPVPVHLNNMEEIQKVLKTIVQQGEIYQQGQQRMLDAIAQTHIDHSASSVLEAPKDLKPRFPPKSPPLHKGRSKDNQRRPNVPKGSYRFRNNKPYERSYDQNSQQQRQYGRPAWASHGGARQNARSSYDYDRRRNNTVFVPVMMQNTSPAQQNQGTYYPGLNTTAPEQSGPAPGMHQWTYPTAPCYPTNHSAEQMPSQGYPGQLWHQ